MAIYREPERTDFWQLAKVNGIYVDPWGPLDCQTHSLSRAIMRQYNGARPAGISGVWPPTGGFIRQVTTNPDGSPDRTGGTNLGQMNQVCQHYYGFTLDVQYGMGWDAMVAEVAKGRGASLSVYYQPIAQSSFSGQSNFYGNHQVFVESVNTTAGTMRVIDPLADGRAAGVYKGPGDYPMSLMKQAAGMLLINATTRVGFGKCYVGLTRVTGDVTPPPPPPVVTDPSTFQHRVAVTANPTINVRTQPTAASALRYTLPYGTNIWTQQLMKSGGAYVVNGVTRTDWYGYKDGNGLQCWVAAGWTRLIS